MAIERGLMAVFIALAVAVGASLLGTGLNKLFTAKCLGLGSGTCPLPMPAGISP